MIKNTLIIASALSLIAASAVAVETKGKTDMGHKPWYFGGSVGAMVASSHGTSGGDSTHTVSNFKKDGTSMSHGIAVGRSIMNGFRAELAYEKINNIGAKGDLAYQYTSTKVVATGPSSAPVTIPNATSLSATAPIKTGGTSAMVMLNGYYDFTINDMFKPYISVGLGYANNKVRSLISGYRVDSNPANINTIGSTYNTTDIHHTSGSKKAMAWSAGLGVTARLVDGIAFDLYYKYVDAGKARVGSDMLIATTATNSGANIISGTFNAIKTVDSDVREVKYRSHLIGFGTRVSF